MLHDQSRPDDRSKPAKPSLPTPGEAEGTRGAADESAPDTPSLPTPGEAEGDRETVEEDLRERG
ncbi:MAG: hypothetical protein ACR2M0_11845 [Chloroflexia bacterium]